MAPGLGLTRRRLAGKELSRGKHGADPDLAVQRRRRAPHRAGHVCRANIPAIGRSSTGACGPRAARPAVSPAVSVRRLPHPGLICSCCDRGQIYCAGDCARTRPAPRTACCRTALPEQPPGTARACRSDAPLSGARQESDASRFTRAAARMICCRPARRRSPQRRSPAWRSGPGGRPRTATGAAVAARHSSARGSCAAASAVATAMRHDRTGPEHGDAA